MFNKEKLALSLTERQLEWPFLNKLEALTSLTYRNTV